MHAYTKLEGFGWDFSLFVGLYSTREFSDERWPCESMVITLSFLNRSSFKLLESSLDTKTLKDLPRMRLFDCDV